MPPFAILLVFSGLRRALVSTDYNRRVAECEEAARLLLAAAGSRHSEPRLGHVSPQEYRTHGSCLSGPAALRAKHFFAEIERVQLGALAWQKGDLSEFGRLVTASGESSITCYECGAPPLIDLHRLLVTTRGVYGARFSGAGFRGCCLALADAERADGNRRDRLGQLPPAAPGTRRQRPRVALPIRRRRENPFSIIYPPLYSGGALHAQFAH